MVCKDKIARAGKLFFCCSSRDDDLFVNRPHAAIKYLQQTITYNITVIVDDIITGKSASSRI
jgi:hypothetical protein